MKISCPAMDEKRREDEFRKAVGAWKRLMEDGRGDGDAKKERTSVLTRLFDDGGFEADKGESEVASRVKKVLGVERAEGERKKRETAGRLFWDGHDADDSAPLTLKEGAEYVGVTYSAESADLHAGVAAPDSTVRSVGKSGGRVSPGTAVTVGTIPMRAVDAKARDSITGYDEDDAFGNREDYYDGSEGMRLESLKRCYKKAMSYGCSRVMTSVPDSVDPVTVPHAETSKGTEADGTSGLTSEIVENLEKHINQQKILIDNYKEALSKKSLKCRKLLAELIRLKEQNSCSTEKQIEACVEKAIGIINDMRALDAGKSEVQDDETKEMRALRLENMNLKVIILELVEQIKQNQGACK